MSRRSGDFGPVALASLLLFSAVAGAASAYPVSNIKISMPANPALVRDCQNHGGKVVERSGVWVCEQPLSSGQPPLQTKPDGTKGANGPNAVVIDPANGKGRPNR
jgi:hypothetical protein